MKRYAQIVGVGSYLPDTVMTNADLEKLVDTSDEWIRTRTGIGSRHVVSPGDTPSDLAARAAKIALDRSGISPDKIDDDAPLFVEGLGLDSVDALEVAAMLSMHFEVEITDKDSAKQVLASIRSIADYIRKQKGA